MCGKYFRNRKYKRDRDKAIIKFKIRDVINAGTEEFSSFDCMSLN
jgi:hypothetical protein